MNPFDLASRFVGEVTELPGKQDAPFIQWCFEACGYGPDTADEVPWCSAFANRIAWICRLPRSKSARARSWLTVGEVIPASNAEPGFDVVILKRGGGNQPGPEVIAAPGHVGFYAGYEPPQAPTFDKPEGRILILGGNQSDGVTVTGFDAARILGIRRLRTF